MSEIAEKLEPESAGLKTFSANEVVFKILCLALKNIFKE